MKAILISDHAKWCALMMNGDKTIEVRKGTALYKAIQKLIDEYGYADIYVYCCKDRIWYNKWTSKTPERYFKVIPSISYSQENKELDKMMNVDFLKKYPQYYGSRIYFEPLEINGKVAFKFRCYKVEEISTWFERDSGDTIFYTNDLEYYELEKKSCLSLTELQDYFTKLLDEDKDIVGCAIHISDLEIFDKPKELSEFYNKRERMFVNGKMLYDYKHYLTEAPQSWCYCESEE